MILRIIAAAIFFHRNKQDSPAPPQKFADANFPGAPAQPPAHKRHPWLPRPVDYLWFGLLRRRPASLATFVVVFLLWTSPVLAQVIVATDVTEDALSANSQPKLARAPDGTIYLAFVKRAGGGSQIFMASSQDGSTFRLQQVTRERGDSRFPSLAVDSGGRVHLTWTQYTEPTGKVYYAQFNGRRWSTPLKLSPGTAYAGVPAIALSQQQPHVVWYGIRQNAPPVLTRHGSIYEILYRGLSRGRWSAPEVISPGIPDAINPGLAVDGAGVLHSAWYQSDARAYQVRHAQRVSAWEQPQQLSSGGGAAAAVSLAVGTDGAVYVVWEHKEAGASRIHVAERHAGWSGQQAISSGGFALNPTVTVNAGGRVYVAWDGDGTIFLRQKAERWLGVERMTRSGKHSHPILSTRGSTVDLVWMEDRGTDRVLRFASLTGSAPATPVGRTRAFVWIIPLALGLILIWQYFRYRRATRT